MLSFLYKIVDTVMDWKIVVKVFFRVFFYVCFHSSRLFHIIIINVTLGCIYSSSFEFIIIIFNTKRVIMHSLKKSCFHFTLILSFILYIEIIS